MNCKLFFVIAAFIPACTIKPTIRSGNQLVTLGGSLFTKTQSETSSYSGPLGNLSYSNSGIDETVLPSKVANYYTTKAIVDGLTNSFKTQQSTSIQKNAQDSAFQSSKISADLEKTKILNPVSETIIP